MKWTKEKEERLLLLRDNHGESFKDIAGMLGTTQYNAVNKYIELKNQKVK